MTPANDNTKQVRAKESGKEPKAYVAPRIISHSGKKLEKDSLTVNACTSFVP